MECAHHDGPTVTRYFAPPRWVSLVRLPPDKDVSTRKQAPPDKQDTRLDPCKVTCASQLLLWAVLCLWKGYRYPIRVQQESACSHFSLLD